MRIDTAMTSLGLVPGRKLILGGVEIPFELGLEGHSDADVLVHAVMDALLGRRTGGHWAAFSRYLAPICRDFLHEIAGFGPGEVVLGGI